MLGDQACFGASSWGETLRHGREVGEVTTLVTGGYGFALYGDVGGTHCLMLAFETQKEADAARKQVANIFARAKRAVAGDRNRRAALADDYA
jgi:hypothetical protein